MKNRLFKHKVIAFLLAVCMSISLFQSSVFAVVSSDSEVLSNGTSTEPAAVYTETKNESTVENLLSPIILTEDVSKRKENEKHFLCDDGSYIAILYPGTVHQEVDGEWVDAEHTVVEKDGNISPVDENINVKFANNTNSSKLVKVETGKYKISWTVEAETESINGIEKIKLSKDSKAYIKATKELVKENKERIKENEKITYNEVKYKKNSAKKIIENTDSSKLSTLSNDSAILTVNEMIESYNRDIIQSVSFLQSNVEYTGAFGEGTTLRYVLTPGAINEEIVLDSYNGFKSYSMVMDTDGLTPIVEEDNTVGLVDKDGNSVMKIAAPYMYDANYAVSYNIGVKVTQEDKKTWRITYTPDIQWLTSDKRAFPIVIDPKVTTQNYPTSDIYDAYVYEGQTSYSNNSEEYLYVGYSGGKKCVSYWGIDTLPAIPSGSTITSAGLYMRFANDSTSCEKICLYTTTGILDTNTLNWSNRPMPSTFMDSQASVPEGLWVNFCSIKFGEQIRNAYARNYHVMDFALAYSGDASHDTYNMFCSADHNIVSYRPYLSVGYTTSFFKLPQGVYRIRNVNSGLYLTTKNNSFANGTKVTQNSLSKNNAAQLWQITATTEGNYYIAPANAYEQKLYHNTDNKPELSSTATSMRTQWRFEEVSSNIYTISSAYIPWAVLDVDNYSLEENATIYAYAKHGYTNQQWQLECVYPIIDIEVLYDNAYDLRYDDEIDIINTLLTELDGFFSDDPRVIFNVVSISKFYSYADTYCSDPYDSDCTHSPESGCHNSSPDNLTDLHHKNLYNILYRTPSPNNPLSTRLVYTGHKTCSENLHGEDYSVAGIAVSSENLAIVKFSSDFEFETLATVHEIGHLLGAKDHYDEEGPNSTSGMNENTIHKGYSDQCIYGRIENDVSDNYKLCAGCKHDIRTYIRNSYLKYNYQ